MKPIKYVAAAVVTGLIIWLLSFAAADRFSAEGRALYAALNGVGVLAYLLYLDWRDARAPEEEPWDEDEPTDD